VDVNWQQIGTISWKWT